MLLDVKKAFLYGAIQRSVYIELPLEDPGRQGGAVVGRLNKAMYGLRDAPQVWQQEVKRILRATPRVPPAQAGERDIIHYQLGVG